MAGLVDTIASKDSFDDLIKVESKLLLFFWAIWHDESKPGGHMDGVFDALAMKYATSKIRFLKVEAEAVSEVSELMKVTVVPTFVALQNGRVIEKLEGVNPTELAKLAKKLNEGVDTSTSISAETKDQKQDNINVRLKKLINVAPVMLFIKGSPSVPKCGFSRQIVEILQSNNIPFASFDILSDEEVRAGLKTYSDWPTYPQLYVNGVLMGGLDIVKEMAAQGDLKEQLGVNKVELPTISNLQERLKSLINTSLVMLFMKGSPSVPKCGFSRQIVEILQSNNIPFASFDILSDEEVRAGLKTYSDWPTYPQLYVNGVLMGGLDIVKEMAAQGDLKEQLGV